MTEAGPDTGGRNKADTGKHTTHALTFTKLGQSFIPPHKFDAKSRSLAATAIIFSSLCFIALTADALGSAYFEDEFNRAAVMLNFAKQAPFFLGPAIAFIGACIYSNWRSSHEVVIKIIDILNSEGFMRTRYELVCLAATANGVEDIEDIDSWFPRTSGQMNNPYSSFDAFKKDHALANMAYLVYQISVYAGNGLIDPRTTRHLFHFFFSHFNIILLEFSYALKIRRNKLATERGFDERWDVFPNGIQDFFRTAGLSPYLPEKHIFIYFPESSIM